MTINCDEEIDRAAILYLAISKIKPQRRTFEQFLEDITDTRSFRDWAITDRLISRCCRVRGKGMGCTG
jgi:hypothetical protein